VSTPDLKLIRKTLESKNVFIVSVSYEQDYDTNTSVVTYKVNVNMNSSYSALFEEIRKLGYISQIKLLA
jgi:putative Mg2+ transporter-C (MgtC) family protein